MTDWADTRAREWLKEWERDWRSKWRDQMQPSLAALLREVKVGEYPCVDCGCLTILQPDQYKMDILAEVRRVVEEIAEGEYCDQGAMARLILSRL